MTAHQMLAEIRDLPPVSPAGLKLVGLLGSAESANEDVVSVLKQDTVLTAKLLRACNSPARGVKEPVMSVDHAVLLLGYRQILQMATALTFRGFLSLPVIAYTPGTDNLWRHSLLAASAAELALAECPIPGTDSSTAFTLGLLHDIGKLITSQFLDRQSLIGIRQELVQGASPVEAERAVLGTDHAEVGASLLHVWRIPGLIIEGVARHHSPVLCPRAMPSVLVGFANFAAHRAEAVLQGREPGSIESCSLVLEALNLTPELLGQVIDRLADFCQDPDQLMLVA
jgi:putative nucleotidyltransferase with HDIG domain